MPGYELFMIVKNMPRPELVKSIKRGAEVILNKNGIIRSFENLGLKNLPFRMKKLKESYQTIGNYIVIKFDVPSNEIQNISKIVQKDSDYLRTIVSPLTENNDPELEIKCLCKERGKFAKNAFDYQKPMTVWDKKKHYKDYSIRL